MRTLSELQDAFKQYAQKQIFTQQPTELYEPIEYILSLGGKAMRPALALMGCNLFSDDVTPALAPAYGVELFHNFSLMHDDIMDKADLRRGKPTVHIRYNTNNAILSGDAMLVYSYQYMSQVDAALLPMVMRIFNQTAIGVCEGQQYDMNFETTFDVDIATYIRMIELKTAVLLEGALEIGALVGGASSEQAELLGEFGRNMGIAFQLKDDYLDTFGEAAKVGKRIGGDILQNKKTYLVLKALEVGDAATRQSLLNWLQSSTDSPAAENAKIEAVTQIFQQLAIPYHIETLIETYYLHAIQALHQLELPEARTGTLRAFIRQIMDREF